MNPQKTVYTGPLWYQGIDRLRGLGIFSLIILHTGFYYWEGLWEVDFDNPPLIVTVIGFLLMFAGLFAILSGFVRTVSMDRDLAAGRPNREVRRKQLASGLFILALAYLYFIFTGPGLARFETSTMNNSILVGLLRDGRLAGTNTDRLLYVDSLVMIGLNGLILAMVYPRLAQSGRNRPAILAALSAIFLLLSLARIPLYTLYTEALEAGRWPLVLALNLLVNKNNPLLPYFSFALLGSALAGAYRTRRILWIVPVGLGLLVLGLSAYITLPDTMLERRIDLKWFSIMVAQAGLFMLMLRGFVGRGSASVEDVGSTSSGGKDLGGKLTRPGWRNFPGRFLERFGRAGLTPFFLESVVAAVLWRCLGFSLGLIPGLGSSLDLEKGGLSFGIAGALGFGLVLALAWGFLLVLWEHRAHQWSVEWIYCRWMERFGGSSKAAALDRRL